MASTIHLLVCTACLAALALATDRQPAAAEKESYAQLQDILRGIDSGDGEKRSVEFSPWGGKRGAFQPWGGKRNSGEVAKRGWRSPPSEDYIRALIKKGFQPWGGKRASFQPWGGKRSVPMDTQDLQERTVDPEEQQNGVDKRAFQPWGGKRAFNAWGGKRAPFDPWGGKRAFNPWGGKRSFNPWGGKRSDETWNVGGRMDGLLLDSDDGSFAT